MEAIALRDELPNVRLGGIWSPLDCTPKAKVIVFTVLRVRGMKASLGSAKGLLTAIQRLRIDDLYGDLNIYSTDIFSQLDKRQVL